MICKKCGKKTESGWRFCPNCGSAIQEQRRSLFDDIFSRFRKEMQDMDKEFEKEFNVLDLEPMVRRARQNKNLKKSGFTIKITRQGGGQPRVDVKTFGNAKPPINRPVQKSAAPPGKPSADQEPRNQKPPRVTEEPVTKVSKSDGSISVYVELPKVKSREDVRINELESSIEVMARAGDKAYFKIITKPEGLRISSKSFENERLSLVFS